MLVLIFTEQLPRSLDLVARSVCVHVHVVVLEEPARRRGLGGQKRFKRRARESTLIIQQTCRSAFAAVSKPNLEVNMYFAETSSSHDNLSEVMFIDLNLFDNANLYILFLELCSLISILIDASLQLN